MQKEEIPSPLAIAVGALFSLWIGVMIAGFGLIFTPVIDPSAKSKGSGSSPSATAKKPAKAVETVGKKFVEGNLNAPFFTYERGQEKAGSNWKSMIDGIIAAKGPADFKETDLNSWYLSLPSNDGKQAGGVSIVPDRANFKIKDGTMTVSAWINVSENKIAFAAKGNFSGSGRSFKIESGHLGSCPLPGFLASVLLSKFSPDTSKYKPIQDIAEAWPKFKSLSLEGDTLKIVP